ncbi:cadherin domain protein, partial [Necator americanus]
ETYSFTVSPGQTLIGSVEVADAGTNTVHYDIAEGAQGAIRIDDSGILYYDREPEKDARNFTIMISARTTGGQFLVATAWVDIAVDGINSYPVKVIGPTQRTGVLSASSKRGTTVANFELTDEDDDAAIQLSIQSISGMFLNGSEATNLSTEMFKVQMNGRKADLVLNTLLFDQPLVSVSIRLLAQDLAHITEPSVPVVQHLMIVRKHPMITEDPIPFGFGKIPKVVHVSADDAEGTFVYAPTLIQSVISNGSSFNFEIESPSNAFTINNSTGTTVVVVAAKDNRGEEVKSYNLDGVDSVFFAIDNKGVIRLMDSIANVPRSELNFVVIAGNGTASSSVSVHIVVVPDENEEISFERSTYEIKVMENLPLNGYVLHLQDSLYFQLLNGDNKHVEYAIETQNDATVIADLLEIDGNGRITTKEELLGYAGTYEFRVRATKGDHHASADVIMHILPAYKCLPSFTPDKNIEFTIEENEPPGTILGTVSASQLNPKCEMKYLLWDPTTHKYTNETKIASIDTSNGVIRSRISFDYEKQAIHPLVLGLQAGAHQFTQMGSTIRVMDVDDHPLKAPMDTVTVEVPEDTPVGTVIATMQANDVDVSQTIFYRLREVSKEFTVNSTTGEVALGSALDRETKDFYTNDNGPLFEQSRYNILVSKNTLPGQPILTVRAFDPDQAEQGNDMKDVFYRIKEMLFDYHGMSRTMENMFSVDQHSGIIRIENSVSEFVGGVFHLLLESMDTLQADAHKDQCIIKVYIHDDSDVVRMELPVPFAALTYDKISTVTRLGDFSTISNATGLTAMIKDLQYHHEEGNLIYDVTDLRLVLVNRTTSEIIPAERAIAIADKRRSAMGDRIPSMTRAQVTSSPVTYQSIPPVAYVLCTFALLLTLVFMIFAFMICHYRSR